jgi:hypothetical protein
VFVSGKYCQPSLMFVGKDRSLPYCGASERCFIHLGSGLTSKHWARLERLARDKHSSLLQKTVNYGRKKFYNIGPRQDYMFEEMKKLSEKYPDFIRMSERRFSTIWGGASLLRMLVSCMQELLAMEDWKWDFVLVLV